MKENEIGENIKWTEKRRIERFEKEEGKTVEEKG